MMPKTQITHETPLAPQEQPNSPEQRLKNEFCLQLINAVNDLILILNSDRRILFANQNVIALFDVDNSEIAQKRLGEVLGCIHSTYHSDGCGASPYCEQCGALQTVKKAIEGTSSKEECRFLRKSGSFYEAMDFLVSATPISTGGSSVLVVTLTDISSEKRRRVLERTFFHDVLNTAGGVSGLTEYLVEVAPPNIQPDLTIIREALNDLIDDIHAQKDLIAAEDNDLSLQFCNVSSGVLLDSARKTYERHPVAQGKHIICDNSCLRCNIESDEHMLRRILGNMVKNALEASLEGDTVVIACNDDDDHTIFSVNNPGHMPHEVQLQIFKRSFTTKGSGRGLGTFAIKLFTESYLGGTAWFTSSEENGTTFYVRIPNTPNKTTMQPKENSMPTDNATADSKCGFSLNSVCCHSCGACCEIAPDLFALDEYGECTCLAQEGPKDLLWEAASHCPNDCIELDGDN